MKGFFEIGVYHPKTEANIGTLWRSAYQLGACGVFTIGRRYKKQCSDTVNAPGHIPMRHYDTIEEFLSSRPIGAELVGVEMGGKLLSDFTHPAQGSYLLGAEDFGLPASVRGVCNRIVSIESIRTASYNVAVAGALIMYDRMYRGRRG